MSMIKLKTTDGEIYVRRERIAFVTPQSGGSRLYICVTGYPHGLDVGFHSQGECEEALAELIK